VELLFDDEWVDAAAGVRRVLASPAKNAEPIVVPDRPWEAEYVHGHMGPFFDPSVGKYRLYYRSRCAGAAAVVRDPNAPVSERPEKTPRTFICLAESEDGERWHKPNLGLFSFQGSVANNIVLEGTGADSAYWNVLYDEAEPKPERRYKGLGVDQCTRTRLPGTAAGERGVCVDYSPDGLHWRGVRDLVMSTRDLTDADCLFPGRDPATGLWTAFFRPRVAPKRRFLGYSVSEDFENWTYPRMLLTPDAADDPFTEFYGMAAASVGDLRAGLMWVYHNNPDYSPMTIELVYSRDGRHYRRAVPRTEFLPLGPEGDFDCRLIVANGILDHGAEHWIYYTGHNYEHGSDRGMPMQRDRKPVGDRRLTGIGLARIPWGHFCGLRADHHGILETKWLCNYGRRGTRVLAHCSEGGRIRAEMLDPYGRVIPGFSADRCVAEGGRERGLHFSWGNGLTGAAGQESSEGGVVGHVVKLRLHLDRATLFGFDIGAAASPAFSVPAQ